ncbi:MAG: DNA polymerase III subunit beta, partial [Deltaproteobacteria bacterium]|nr:DNA polymerase III subunit beta [Deltaproteobacteria bacterium]
MEIKINRDDLLRSVARVQNIIEKRSNMPILSTVLMTAEGSHITLSATDLELGLRQTLPAQVGKEGSVTISGRKLFEILKESKKEQVEIRARENNWVHITDQVARFNLACMPPEDFPAIAAPEEVVSITLDGVLLGEMISKTIYAVTMEEAGFKLSGVFVEKAAVEGETFLRMVATDGHRLSMVDHRVPGVETLEMGSGVMIPKKGMAELGKLAGEGGEVELGFKQNTCLARKGDAFLMIRLLETKFPDYRLVIPKEETCSVSLDRIALLDAMRKMVILSNERYRAVKVSIQDGEMELVSTNPDLGDAQETMAVDYRGDALEMGFNARYFIDVLQAMES